MFQIITVLSTVHQFLSKAHDTHRNSETNGNQVMHFRYLLTGNY